MNTSSIAQGQMFIQFPSPIVEIQQTPKPKVWVRVGPADFEDDCPVSLFVDNDAMVGVSIGLKKKLNIHEKWLISDNYYNLCVSDGRFVPIEDLREVEAICAERGCEMPENSWLL